MVPDTATILGMDLDLGESFQTLDLHTYSAQACYFMAYLQTSQSIIVFEIIIQATTADIVKKELTTANMPFTATSFLRGHYIANYGTMDMTNYILIGQATQVKATDTNIWSNSYTSGFLYAMTTSIFDTCYSSDLAYTSTTGSISFTGDVWTEDTN